MKKYLFIIILITIIAATAIYFMKAPDHSTKKETICLAIVSNTGEKAGQEMINGASLYIKEMNEKGGLFGKQVRLKVFDDMGKPKKATNIASIISESNQILLVLGNSNNATSIAAGRIYKKVGIPAIAASATSQFITRDNEWYFRIIPNDEFQAKFIANYIYRALKIPSACIISDTDDFGKTLSSFFESEANSIGLLIKRKWELNRKDKSLSQDINNILISLRSVEQPGILFLATHASESSEIISSVHYPKTNLKIIGTSELCSELFKNRLNKKILEQQNPGFFSDGIYAVLPYMPELSDKDGIRFNNHYLRAYQHLPSWHAASYYDAAKLAFEAIKKSGIGHVTIGKKRMNIKDSLQSMYHVDYAVKGVSGHIYFSKSGDCEAPLKVGKYEKQMFIPSFTEYRLDTDRMTSQNMGAKVLKGEKLIVDDIVMSKMHIVYSGISVNSIDNLNINNQTCTFDFYIWFKYKEAFDPSKVVFENAVHPIQLKNPTIQKNGATTICSFHVVADFKHSFDFRRYPFDSQSLQINYRHTDLTDEELKFVIDKNDKETNSTKQAKLDINSGWEIQSEYMYQDIVMHESRIGSHSGSESKASYSQMSYNTRIQRSKPGSVIRRIIPVAVIMVLSVLLIFISHQKTLFQILLVSGLFVTNALYHINCMLTLKTGYITALEFVHISIYILLAYIVFNALIFQLLQKKQFEKGMYYFGIISRFVYVLIFLGIGYLIYSFF